MAESVNLEKLVSNLVDSAPSSELNEVSEQLNTIIGSNSVIKRSVEQYVEDKGIVVSGSLIASKYNKHPTSSKYIDYVKRKQFNIDVSKQSSIDIEDYHPDVEYPSYFEELVTALETYGNDFYPSHYAFTLVPKGETLDIIIIGKKSNKQNFYTGEWKSLYSVDKNGKIKGNISIDIHYFEDGNVRLEFSDDLDENVSHLNATSLVNVINTTENRATLKILKTFNDLNVQSFKNLRRILPVTRSKINWGSAIGNYRLGSDVVNQ